MRLVELVGSLDEAVLRGDAAVEVTGVRADSRRVEPGDLFCCVPGSHTDGHTHGPGAVDAGAAALLCEHPLDLGVPEILVPDVRQALGPVSAAFHGHPSRRLTVVGVTGTNGKTTVVHLLASVLSALGERTEPLGTLTGARTTPEAPDLQESLARLVREGVAVVAMEVSSHALSLHRVDATRFELAIFTNLGHDHLDFHPSLEDYFEAKARLFQPEMAAQALVDRDDPWGRRLLDRLEIPAVAYSLEDLDSVQADGDGAAFCWRGQRVRLPLPGRFNLSNALAVAEAAVLLGHSPDAVARALAEVPPVAGRFEPVDEGQPFRLFVDYAHTPEALETSLAAARDLAGDAPVTVVFGCGGDRDHEKRPAMGRVAVEGADRVVLTTDNPRRESPEAIVTDVLAGVPDPRSVVLEPDRAAAISLAVREAGPGEVVVIAGKGHEREQEVGGVRRPFDDREEARRALTREAHP